MKFKFNFKKNRNLKISAVILLCAVVVFLWWEVYVPKVKHQTETITYSAQKGMGDEDIARELQDQGIIKNRLFFEAYVIGLGKHSKLQAGSYILSPSMSIAEIADKFIAGDVIKDNVTLLEGWDARDIAKYLEGKNIFSKKDFLAALQIDFSEDFIILNDKPKNISLEGYVFPDTYQISIGETPQDFLENTIANLDKKLIPELRAEIALQNKSIFQIITMASILEKELKSTKDKKIVAGILWKRLSIGMPLQVDATINYITDKNDARVAIKDTKINSPYNTYKYAGLPAGPISSPGMDSILAAIYPTKTDYWYYLSAKGNGKTIFSATLGQHNIARAKYLGS